MRKREGNKYGERRRRGGTERKWTRVITRTNKQCTASMDVVHHTPRPYLLKRMD